MTIRYFDYAASCPAFPEALEEFTKASAGLFANPSSAHGPGNQAHKAMVQMKQRLAELCGWKKAGVILTSGATEANNLVIRGLMEKYPKGRLLLAADVHESAWFAKNDYKKRVDIVPLQSDGRLSLKKLRDSLKKETALFSAVHVCHETGVIHDIATYGVLCKKAQVLFHCDGVQALGHIDVDLEHVPVDLYCFSAHKFGGPRGVGGVLTTTVELVPQISGGGQEQHLRAGTENVPGLAAALKALELGRSKMAEESLRLQKLSADFLAKLSENIGRFVLNSTHAGLPGLISISFPGTRGTNLVAELSLRGFAVSSGSACHSNDVRPSRIIMALGRSEHEAHGTLRISMGRDTNQDDTKALAMILGQVVNRQISLA